MCTTKLSVMAAALVLFALGPGAAAAHAQDDLSLEAEQEALEHEAERDALEAEREREAELEAAHDALEAEHDALALEALEYEAPPPLEAPRTNPNVVAQRRLSLGFGIAGIATGAVGLFFGSVLLIAGTTRTHCEGSWLSDSHRCSPAPNDTGDVAGGALSIGLGVVAVITGIVLVATRPRRSGPTLSFGGDSNSVSVSIDGTF